MKDQNGKPENGNGERVLKIAEVCRPDSKREQNPFPGKQVLCAGAEDARVRLDGVNPNLSAIISVIDASGKEIDRAEIAEGETKSVAGRVITLVGVSLLAGAACEYNYTYDYGDQDAVTNPPLVCPTIPVTDRCEGGDNPNQLSCTAYVGSAVDFDGYLFRVAEVREESGVTKVYVDVLEQSLDCRLLHTLELTVGVENGFSVGTDNYTILPRWAEIGADPDAPAVVGLDITKTYTEPAGPICAEETDRCFYRNDNGVRCTAYENRAVEFDGYLFVAYSISDGIVEIDVQDKELGCERIASLSVEAGGDERLYSPSFLGGGATYAIRARGATIGTGTVPPTVDLEVRRVSDEPAPTVCPETTDRCEEGLLGSVICSIYQDMAAEVNGVLFAVRNVREEGGVTKFDLEVSDRELGCGVSQTLILGNRDNANVTIGTQSFNLFVGNIVLDGTASWVYLAINPNADICSTVHVSERCEGTASSVRCMVYNGDALEMDGVLFFVNSVSTDPATASVSIYDRAAGCTGAAGEEHISIPSVRTFVVGSYLYRVTLLNATSYGTYPAVEMQVEREPILCGGAETRGILNVGELIDTGIGLRVRLDDISRDGEAMLTVFDSADNEFMRMTLAEGEAYLLEYGGRSVVVYANEVAAGVLLIGKWADITVQACD